MMMLPGNKSRNKNYYGELIEVVASLPLVASWHFGEVIGNLLFNHQLIQQHQYSKVKVNAVFTLDFICSI